MAIELEYKLAVPTPALLETILFDPQVAQVRQGGYRLIDMATIYYDTADGALSSRRWTLRLRQENDALVATVKTPGPNGARGEWECEALSISAAVPQLIEAGAPAELAELVRPGLVPVCAARFTRRVCRVAFADGTCCELCGDIGALVGGSQEAPLCEVEVELKSGDQETARAFAEELQERFGLEFEQKSKFLRAFSLREANA